MLKRAVVVCCALWAVSSATGEIEEWGGANPEWYHINPTLGTVRILHAGTFKFQSVTNEELDDINLIYVDPPVAGTVTVHVARKPQQGGGDGARHVREVNLSDATTGNLQEMLVSGNYGENGPLLATNAGTLEIGADVLDDIDITEDITGPITIAGILAADISCDSLADLTVTGGTAGPAYPNITIRGPYADTLDVHGNLGTVHVRDWLSETGQILVGGDLESLVSGPLAGEIRWTGSW